MSQRVYVATDDFNRTDADPAGGVWVLQNGVSGNIKIVSNKIQTSSGVANGAEVVYDTGVLPWLNQFAQITVPTFTPTLNDGADFGVLFRTAGGSVRQFYSVVGIEQGNGGFSTQIAKRVAGTFTSLTTNNTGTWTSGDVLLATCVGINPTSFEVFRNGVSLFTFTDSEATLQVVGKTGIRMRPITGAADVICDDFQTGVAGSLGRGDAGQLYGISYQKAPYQQRNDTGIEDTFL